MCLECFVYVYTIYRDYRLVIVLFEICVFLGRLGIVEEENVLLKLFLYRNHL